jgi:hypothetical protein
VKYKFLSAILAVGFLVCGAEAKNFGNPDVSIEKIFPHFNVKNADTTVVLVDVFRVTDKEFNAFVEQIEKKAAAEKHTETVFMDDRKNIKGVGKERLFQYTTFDMSKDGKDSVLVIAEGNRNINGGLEIRGGTMFLGKSKKDLNETALVEFLVPINAPRLNIGIRKEFKNTNLTKECEEYIDTLKKKHSFDMPNDFKMLKDVYNTLNDAKQKQEMERLFNSMTVKYAGDFKYTAVCKFEGGTSTIDLNIERVKFQD